MMDKHVYIDGSFKDGVGGWAVALLEGEDDVHYVEVESGKVSTSYSTELEGFLLALNLSINIYDSLDFLHVYTDSQNLIDDFQHYVVNFSEFGNMKCNHKFKSDKSRWKNIRKITNEININFIKVKGHSGNEVNDLVDRLAKSARKNQRNWVEKTSQRLKLGVTGIRRYKLNSKMRLLKREFDTFIKENKLCNNSNIKKQHTENDINLAFLCWCGAKGVSNDHMNLLKNEVY